MTNWQSFRTTSEEVEPLICSVTDFWVHDEGDDYKEVEAWTDDIGNAEQDCGTSCSLTVWALVIVFIITNE